MEVVQVINKQTLRVEKTYRLTTNTQYDDILLKGLEMTFNDHLYWIRIKFIDLKFWQ